MCLLLSLRWTIALLLLFYGSAKLILLRRICGKGLADADILGKGRASTQPAEKPAAEYPGMSLTLLPLSLPLPLNASSVPVCSLHCQSG